MDKSINIKIIILKNILIALLNSIKMILCIFIFFNIFILLISFYILNYQIWFYDMITYYVIIERNI